MKISSRQLVAVNVRRIRKIRGISQKDLAVSMGRAQARVSEIERGTHPVSDKHLDLLSKALTVPVSKLLEEPDAARVSVKEGGPEYSRRVCVASGRRGDVGCQKVPKVHGAGACDRKDSVPEV